MLPVGTSSNPPIARSVPSTAPIGITPPPIALPRQTMSGRTSQCSTANIRPVRPNPVFTSSAQSSQPCSRHSSVSAGQKPSGGTSTPPEPTIGSTITPATSSGCSAWNSTWSRR